MCPASTWLPSSPRRCASATSRRQVASPAPNGDRWLSILRAWSLGMFASGRCGRWADLGSGLGGCRRGRAGFGPAGAGDVDLAAGDGDGPGALVDGAVVRFAEQREGVDRGGAAVDPV